MKPYIHIVLGILLIFIGSVLFVKAQTDDDAIKCATRWSGAPVKIRYVDGVCQVSRDGSIWWPENAIKINLWNNK